MRKSGNEYRFTGTYSVELPTLPTLQARPSVVELHQVAGQHEVAVLSFPNYRPAWSQLLVTGTPVIINLSNGKGNLRWTGYVNMTSQVSAAQLDRPTQVYCIGTSFPLKERATRVFSDTTIPEAVEVIARETGLNYVGEPHPRKFAQLAISGETYWQWIQAQAARIGYVALVEGSNLFFRSLDRTIDERMSFVPAYRLDGNLANTSLRNLRSRTLDYFRVVHGEYNEAVDEVRTSKVVAAVDSGTRQVISSTSFPQDVGSPLRRDVSGNWFSGYETDEVVENLAQATRAAEDAAQRVRLSTEARLRGFGEPRVGVYSTVLVEGTGARTDGYWVVKECHQRIDLSGLYVADMVVQTDGLGEDAGSTFRRRFPHENEAIDIRSRLLANTQGRGVTGTKLRTNNQVLSTRGTARKRTATPGQWVVG